MEKDNMSMKGLPKLGTGKEFTGVSKKLAKGIKGLKIK
jgi:hypothetical protein